VDAVYRQREKGSNLRRDSNAPGLGRIGRLFAKFLFGALQKITKLLYQADPIFFGSVCVRFWRLSV
jgi:hypothetical protein